jgi:hypothetical protein
MEHGVSGRRDGVAVGTPRNPVVRGPTILVATSILIQKPVDAIVGTNVENQLAMEPSSEVAADVTRSLLIFVPRLDGVEAWWKARRSVGIFVVEFDVTAD